VGGGGGKRKSSRGLKLEGRDCLEEFKFGPVNFQG